MKTNSFQDPRLARAVLGRKRIHIRRSIGVPVRESIEYKIIQKKKELGLNSRTPQYQMLFLGEWRNITEEQYLECIKLNQQNIRIL